MNDNIAGDQEADTRVWVAFWAVLLFALIGLPLAYQAGQHSGSTGDPGAEMDAFNRGYEQGSALARNQYDQGFRNGVDWQVEYSWRLASCERQGGGYRACREEIEDRLGSPPPAPTP